MTTTKPRKQRKLGHVQRHVLSALNGWGYYYPGCGWRWGNTSTTVRVLESLVRRGLVIRTEETNSRTGRPMSVYRPVQD